LVYFYFIRSSYHLVNDIDMYKAKNNHSDHVYDTSTSRLFYFYYR
jgi:hypothetical protein